MNYEHGRVVLFHNDHAVVQAGEQWEVSRVIMTNRDRQRHDKRNRWIWTQPGTLKLRRGHYSSCARRPTAYHFNCRSNGDRFINNELVKSYRSTSRRWL